MVDFTGRIVAGGSTLTATITTGGHAALVIFEGTVGQRVTVASTNVTISGAIISILAPNGTTLTSGGTASTLESPALPVNGTYTLLVQGNGTSTGSVTLTLSAELTGTIVQNGAAVPLSLSRIGQYARYAFAGATGQQISLSLSTDTISEASVSIIKPDGTTLTGPTLFYSGGGFLDAQTLPLGGVYTILVAPYSTYTGTITLTLYGFADVTGSVTVNGSSVSPSITTPGQNALYTFTGTAGQWVSAAVTNSTVTTAYLSILNPNGTTLWGPTSSKLDSVQLPSGGSYTLKFDPYGTSTGNATLWVSSDLTGTMTVDGSPVALTLSRAGQNARYSFSGTAGQLVNVGVTGDTVSPVGVSVLNPNGTTLAGPTWIYPSSGSLHPAALPSTGTYNILADPYLTNTGNLTLTLSSTVVGTLTVGGAAANIALNEAGQTAQYTFSGTATQPITVHVTNNTITAAGCVTVTLYNPGQAYLTSTNSCSASFNLTSQTLATTGTYTLTVIPYSTNTGSLSLSVSSP